MRFWNLQKCGLGFWEFTYFDFLGFYKNIGLKI